MENQSSKQSLLSVLKECLTLWRTFYRGKEILVENGTSYNGELSPRSRLFDRIGRLVFFDPKDMGCHWDFFMVPGDRRHRRGYYTDISAANIHDNQTRVRVRELLSKKAAKAGVVVVLIGAAIAPFSVQHMTPIHPFGTATFSSIGATFRHF